MASWTWSNCTADDEHTKGGLVVNALPRVMIAGLAGDVGKSLVSLGVVGALRRLGLGVAAFKKGPDYIDAAWLGAAADSPGHNLDTFFMPKETILASLWRASHSAAIGIVEANRGLFDGLDAQGSHSSATLARLIGTPIILVLNATKVTRSLVALVLGCQALDPGLGLGGVILNCVSSSRQESVIRQALANVSDLPVLGAIPRLEEPGLPARHLGLVPPTEHPAAQQLVAVLSALIARHVDLPLLRRLAASAPPLTAPAAAMTDAKPVPSSRPRIGVLRDRAFSFYYPDNLAALETAGADLVPISPLGDAELPEVDALYAGGGFPEEYAPQLSANASLRTALAARIDAGLPVWAECGGLMYLSGGLVYRGRQHPMVGVLPVTIAQGKRPQGHGYVEGRIDRDNPFLPVGTRIRGHEFHYSCLASKAGALSTALAVGRGTGVGDGRDGIIQHNVWASYTHLHALGVPEWAPALVRAAIAN